MTSNGRAREVEMMDAGKQTQWLAMEIDKVESRFDTRFDSQDSVLAGHGDELSSLKQIAVGILVSLILLLIAVLAQLVVGT